MPGMFISYRRDDTAGLAGRLYDTLRLHFGTGSVFLDADSIPPGADFRQFIQDSIRQCDMVLALVGKHWLVTGLDGRRRIDDPGDFVRVEIEVTLAAGIPIVPVLVGDTPMPREADLPAAIAEFAYRNAARLDPTLGYHTDAERLVNRLENIFGRPTFSETAVGREGQIPFNRVAGLDFLGDFLGPILAKAARDQFRASSSGVAREKAFALYEHLEYVVETTRQFVAALEAFVRTMAGSPTLQEQQDAKEAVIEAANCLNGVIYMTPHWLKELNPQLNIHRPEVVSRILRYTIDRAETLQSTHRKLHYIFDLDGFAQRDGQDLRELLEHAKQNETVVVGAIEDFRSFLAREFPFKDSF